MPIAPTITTTGITALVQPMETGASTATYPRTAMSANTSAHISVSTRLVRRNAAFSHSCFGAEAGAYCAVKGTNAKDPSDMAASTPLDSVVAYVSIQSRSSAPTIIPTMVTATKNTMVTTSSRRGPPRPADTPRIRAAITAHIAPNIQVLGPSATTQ